VIAFRQPGDGKTHLLAGLGHELARQDRTVLIAPAFQIVQRLLAAKRDLRLTAELRKLDCFEALILDDIGYVQQNREEMKVLFTLPAERYERTSVLITSKSGVQPVGPDLQRHHDHVAGCAGVSPSRNESSESFCQMHPQIFELFRGSTTGVLDRKVASAGDPLRIGILATNPGLEAQECSVPQVSCK
jgi:hypothetical protein